MKKLTVNLTLSDRAHLIFYILMNKFVLIISCSFFLLSCNGDTSRELVLFDFESDSELDELHWKCHTLFSISQEHVTHGAGSLKMELYPSDYPGLPIVLKENDWSNYKILCFDIYNPEKRKVQIFIRIDDRRDYPDYKERYNNGFIIKPEMNRISIPLNTLVTSGTGRKLNLKKIYSLLVFMVNPGKRVIMYVDYIRLK